MIAGLRIGEAAHSAAVAAIVLARVPHLVAQAHLLAEVAIPLLVAALSPASEIAAARMPLWRSG